MNQNQEWHTKEQREKVFAKYQLHNVAPPHDPETCEVCKGYEELKK